MHTSHFIGRLVNSILLMPGYESFGFWKLALLLIFSAFCVVLREARASHDQVTVQTMGGDPDW